MSNLIANIDTVLLIRLVCSLAQLDELGEALLDFTQLGDLLTWLDRN